jgi:hypothetical protein
MIIYNLTVNITHQAHNEWMKWLKEEHLPEIIETKTFYDIKIYQLINIEEADGPTYSVQFFARSMEEYDIFINEYAPAFINKSVNKWGDEMFSFRTTLKNIDYQIK